MTAASPIPHVHPVYARIARAEPEQWLHAAFVCFEIADLFQDMDFHDAPIQHVCAIHVFHLGADGFVDPERDDRLLLVPGTPLIDLTIQKIYAFPITKVVMLGSHRPMLRRYLHPHFVPYAMDSTP